jgi:hypothetical protein
MGKLTARAILQAAMQEPASVSNTLVELLFQHVRVHKSA